MTKAFLGLSALVLMTLLVGCGGGHTKRANRSPPSTVSISSTDRQPAPKLLAVLMWSVFL